MSTVPACTSAAEALAQLCAAIGYLAAADATALPAGTRARCLRALEQVTSIGAAARTSILAAFTVGQDHGADGDYSPGPGSSTAPASPASPGAPPPATPRGSAGPRPTPRVLEALAAGEMPESVARTVCDWTGRLLADCIDAADKILVTAARAGVDLPGLARLAAEICARGAAR
jgi:hypothetical protein